MHSSTFTKLHVKHESRNHEEARPRDCGGEGFPKLPEKSNPLKSTQAPLE